MAPSVNGRCLLPNGWRSDLRKPDWRTSGCVGWMRPAPPVVDRLEGETVSGRGLPQQPAFRSPIFSSGTVTSVTKWRKELKEMGEKNRAAPTGEKEPKAKNALPTKPETKPKAKPMG